MNDRRHQRSVDLVFWLILVGFLTFVAGMFVMVPEPPAPPEELKWQSGPYVPTQPPADDEALWICQSGPEGFPVECERMNVVRIEGAL